MRIFQYKISPDNLYCLRDLKIGSTVSRFYMPEQVYEIVGHRENDNYTVLKLVGYQGSAINRHEVYSNKKQWFLEQGTPRLMEVKL